MRRHAARAAPVLSTAHGSAGSHYGRRTPWSVVAVSVKNEDKYLEKGAIFGYLVTATSRPRHLAMMTTIQPNPKQLFVSSCHRCWCDFTWASSPGFDRTTLATRARCPNHCSGTVGRCHVTATSSGRDDFDLNPTLTLTPTLTRVNHPRRRCPLVVIWSRSRSRSWSRPRGQSMPSLSATQRVRTNHVTEFQRVNATLTLTLTPNLTSFHPTRSNLISINRPS